MKKDEEHFVILHSYCVFQEPFAAFQSLPLDGSALSESPDAKAALMDCREKLGLACVGHWYPRRPRPEDGQRGLWQLTVQVASAPAGGRGGFVRRIRELAGEPDIVFRGAQVPGGRGRLCRLSATPRQRGRRIRINRENTTA